LIPASEARSVAIVNHKVGEVSAPDGSDSTLRRLGTILNDASALGEAIARQWRYSPRSEGRPPHSETTCARHIQPMLDGTTLFVAAVFVLAGLTKGVIGLGLPTISMGLLVLVMTPPEAAALLVLPSFLTNLWQMLAGPSLRSVCVRLWPMMLGACLGTWSGAGLMMGPLAMYGSGLLGLALVAYALTGLFAMGVIPAVPYLQAIGLEKDELVQALGLSFTVSTIALAVNLASAGALGVSIAGAALSTLAMACVGMWIGQSVRLSLRPATFRRCFFVGLLMLGAYLAGRSVF
jgi:uncharacterized protein